MTRMKDVAWPQATHNMISEASPYGLANLKDDKGSTVKVSLNRATRRRMAVQMATRLERLVDQEDRNQRVRKVTHK